MQQLDLFRNLLEDVRTLRAEIHGKVDVGVLERIDQTIMELERFRHSPDGPRNALILLGIIVEYLPSIIKAIDSLIHK